MLNKTSPEPKKGSIQNVLSVKLISLIIFGTNLVFFP